MALFFGLISAVSGCDDHEVSEVFFLGGCACALSGGV